jgi:hypothetical protein
MKQEQQKRYNKIYQDEFYILDHQELEKNYEFTMSGSTRSVYKINIYKDGSTFCNCPAAKNHVIYDSLRHLTLSSISTLALKASLLLINWTLYNDGGQLSDIFERYQTFASYFIKIQHAAFASLPAS